MNSITGNLAFDIFIIESNKKYQKILQNIYEIKEENIYTSFDEFLNNYNYKKKDFTDVDYMRLKDIWNKHM